MNGLLKSRKFWMAMLDMGISLATYFITKYAAPAAANDVLYVIGALQVPTVAIIAAITAEDVANYRSGGVPGKK